VLRLQQQNKFESSCEKAQSMHLTGSLYPNVAKAGGLQSQGVKGEAVIGYRKPLTTQGLKSSGFPEG